MAVLRTWGPLTGGLLLIMVGGVWFAHTSLWFLWGMATAGFPEDQIIALDIPSAVRPVVTQLEASYHLSSVLPLNLADVRRFAWRRGTHSEVVIVIPALGKTSQVRQSLRQSGYTTSRLGGVLVASQATDTKNAPSVQTQLTSGTQEVLRHMWFDNLPLQPRGIAQLPALPGLLESGGRVVIFEQREQLVATFRSGRHWPDIRTAGSQTNAHEEKLQFAIPGHILTILPGHMQEQWERHVIEQLGLTASRPKIVKGVEQFTRVMLVTGKEEAAIGATGTASTPFRQQAESWLVAEQGYRSPTTVAFRLPDGTLGYEKRPGAAPLTWQATSDSTCQTTTVGEVQYWLCQTGDAAAVGRSEASARYVLGQLGSPTTWQVHLTGDQVQKIAPLPITALTLSSAGEHQAILWADTAY